MYRVKTVQRSDQFVEAIEDEVKQLCVAFPQQPMTELSDVLKSEHEAEEKCHISFKEFTALEKRKARGNCYYAGL